jgi:hypothetical protein
MPVLEQKTKSEKYANLETGKKLILKKIQVLKKCEKSWYWKKISSPPAQNTGNFLVPTKSLNKI